MRRIAAYIHELADWPNFRWDQGGLAKQLAAVRLRQGRLIGRMQTPGFRQQEEAVLTTLTEDVLKSSEIEGAEKTLAAVFQKADFWKKHAAAKINERQRDMLDRRLDGIEGKLTSSKWALLEKCSPDTALRDIQDLLDQGILTKDEGGGRSTSYSLATE